MIFGDLETRSYADLRVVGGWAYANDPSTQIFSGVFVRGSECRVWSPLVSGIEASACRPEGLFDDWDISIHFEETPPILDWLSEPWVFHNGHAFDAHVWGVAGFPAPVEWVDSLRIAKSRGLPGSLDAIGEYLFGVGKDAGGSSLLALSKPHHKTGRFLPLHARNLTPILRYNVMDVALMKKLWETELAGFENTFEARVLAADHRINRAGIPLDVKLAERIIAVETSLREMRGDDLERLTGGKLNRALLRSTPRFKTYLETEHGLSLPNVQRGTLCELLDEADLDPEARVAIEGRIGETRITSAKLSRGLEGLARDDMVRDVLFYHAALTGRWGGRRLQPHNLLRGRLKPEMVDACIAVLLPEGPESSLPRSGSGHVFDAAKAARRLGEIIPENVTTGDALGSLVRPCLVAGSRGRSFGAADYGSVEARGVFWLVGDSAGLDEFRADVDPYLAFGSRALGCTPEEVAERGLRQAMKAPVLGAGYQLGGEKLATYAAGMGIDLAEYGFSGPELVELWRDHNPLVAGVRTGDEYAGVAMREGGFWREFQAAASDVARGGPAQALYCCGIEMSGPHFVLTLPSGREILYRHARVDPVVPSWGGEPRDTFCYDRAWGSKVLRAPMYGGRWMENIVQALCRDLLAEALVRMVEAGLDVLFHVHDEIVWIAESDEELRAGMELMNETPEWALGFPCKTAGWRGTRYSKDSPKDATEYAILGDGYGGSRWT